MRRAQGIRDAGVKDNEGVLIFSGLMDSRSLFLTANADTVYFIANIDLTKGPMVIETPPDALGLFDDLWFRWVIDFGAPGPDRGLGGKYLLLPPGYDGPLPDGGYFIGRPTTTSVALLGRAFLVNNDPKPTVEVDQENAQDLSLRAGLLSERASARSSGGRVRSRRSASPSRSPSSRARALP